MTTAVGAPSEPHAFRAPRWLRSGHVQTLGAALPLWTTPRDLREERLWFPLGDAAEAGALHARAWWHAGDDGAPLRRPTVLVLHGVASSSEAQSVVRGGRALYRAGMHVVRLDLRGAGDGVARAPSVYHAGLTEDPRVAIAALAGDPRVASLALVGISLGGHVALKLAGEWGDAFPAAVRAVVTVSSPVDIARATDEIDRLRNLPYCAYVLHGLVKQALAFARAHPDKTRFDARRLRRVRKVREYHDLVIAPMHGFDGADDYHARASAAPHLSHVRVPTLMIHADDDPMVPLDTVAPYVVGRSPAIRFVATSGGGHVGWLGGLREADWVHTWAMDRAIAFVRDRANQA